MTCLLGNEQPLTGVGGTQTLRHKEEAVVRVLIGGRLEEDNKLTQIRGLRIVGKIITTRKIELC